MIKKFSPAHALIVLLPLLSCNSGNDITANDSAANTIADTTISTPIADDTPVVKTIQDTAVMNLVKVALIDDLVKNDLSILTENDRRFIFLKLTLTVMEKTKFLWA